MTNPKLSIITINLNNINGLRKTIVSVVNQTYVDFEYIIIDGGSTDGSAEIIKKFADKIIYWISEPDKGIYNAMNKGIKKASGKYCLFLNSGDVLTNSDILEKCFNRPISEDIAYCNLIIDNGKNLNYKKFPSELTFFNALVSFIGHPSTFIKRELFYKIGFYNEKYKIVSDWEFFLKAIFICKCSLYYLDEYLTIFNTSGISSKSAELDREERLLVLEELFPRFMPDYKKLILLSGYTQIHSGNKYIRKFAGFINRLLVLHRKRKTKCSDSIRD